MKARPTKENIANIKDELKQILIQEGVINNTSSLSKMKNEFKQTICDHEEDEIEDEEEQHKQPQQHRH